MYHLPLYLHSSVFWNDPWLLLQVVVPLEGLVTGNFPKWKSIYEQSLKGDRKFSCNCIPQKKVLYIYLYFNLFIWNHSSSSLLCLLFHLLWEKLKIMWERFELSSWEKQTWYNLCESWSWSFTISGHIYSASLFSMVAWEAGCECTQCVLQNQNFLD